MGDLHGEFSCAPDDAGSSRWRSYVLVLRVRKFIYDLSTLGHDRKHADAYSPSPLRSPCHRYHGAHPTPCFRGKALPDTAAQVFARRVASDLRFL
jgi:hypothetical protein